MITLIGLGNTGKKIVENLSTYKQYKTLTLDSGKEFKTYTTPEEYENNCPSFKKIFKNVEEEIYLFLSASGKISGASLRILEQLKEQKINVVCITSDPVTLSSMGVLQQNLVVGVMQEYARSGMIENLYLFSNSKIEEMLPDIGIDEYWDKINETIAYIFHTYMYFKNTKPIMEFGDTNSEIAKIHTFSVLDKEKEKKSLYDLRYITNELYFFTYSKKNNKNFLKEIKKFIEEQVKEKKVGTFIYESETVEPVTYVLASTHIPQTSKTEL